METIYTQEEDKGNGNENGPKVFKTEEVKKETKSPFRKNSRAPWDLSALEGIRLKSSLSALRIEEIKKKKDSEKGLKNLEN